MSNIITKLTVARKNFERVQSNLKKYGTLDSEPDYVFQEQLHRAVQGKPYIPLSADEWQLYTSYYKCNNVAKRLNAATEKIVNIISAAPISDLVVIEAWTKQFCWRLDF